MYIVRKHLSSEVSLNYFSCKKLKEQETLEDLANKILFQNGLLGRLGIVLEEKGGLNRFVLAGKMEDDKQIFQRISAAIQKITEKTDINVIYGLEKRGNFIIFSKPLEWPIDFGEHILRQYPELNGLKIKVETADCSPRFVLSGRIDHTREAFDKFKTAIKQITEETDMNVSYGMKISDGTIWFNKL